MVCSCDHRESECFAQILEKRINELKKEVERLNKEIEEMKKSIPKKRVKNGTEKV